MFTVNLLGMSSNNLDSISLADIGFDLLPCSLIILL